MKSAKGNDFFFCRKNVLSVTVAAAVMAVFLQPFPSNSLALLRRLWCHRSLDYEVNQRKFLKEIIFITSTNTKNNKSTKITASILFIGRSGRVGRRFVWLNQFIYFSKKMWLLFILEFSFHACVAYVLLRIRNVSREFDDEDDDDDLYFTVYTAHTQQIHKYTNKFIQSPFPIFIWHFSLSCFLK